MIVWIYNDEILHKSKMFVAHEIQKTQRVKIWLYNLRQKTCFVHISTKTLKMLK